MTSMESIHGKVEIVNARRTESIDAAGVILLAKPETEILFGRKNVVHVIEKAVLAVTLHNTQDVIFGHGAFYDYPNISSIDPAVWEDWFDGNYSQFENGHMTTLNCLFIHYFVTKKDYALGCGKEIIRTVFNAMADLQYILLSVPIGSFPDPALSDFFEPVKRKRSSSDIVHSLFVCHRYRHVPELYVRTAEVEDHDDLTPVFNAQTDVLDKTYGRFFLAELIEAQDEHMQCLVVENEGTSVGFMSISDDINLDLLNQCYELGPFHGLRYKDDNDVLFPCANITPVSYPEASPMKFVPSGDTIATENLPRDDQSKLLDDIAQKTSEVPQDVSAQSVTKLTTNISQEMPSTSDVKCVAKLSESHMMISPTVTEERSSAQLISPLQDIRCDSSKSVKAADIDYSLTNIPPPKLTTVYKSHPPPHFVPKYFGPSNAFAVQLFCIEDKYETRSCDFLKKAFELFPDKEYCIITVPHLVPVFPLLQIFTRATPRCPSTISQELYVFHKSGLLKNMKVRFARSSDIEKIKSLVKSLVLSENIMTRLDEYLRLRRNEDGVQLQAVVAECGDAIVGICIMQHEHDIEYVRSHYNIEDFIYFNHHDRRDHGHIFHFALSPAYSHYTKYFLKDMMRIAHKSSLYYPVYPGYIKSPESELHSMATCLNDMVPVHARRQIEYPVDALGINAPSDRVLQIKEPYTLNHINRKLTLEPKVTINARIVVVGASDVGIAFLQTLVYCPHLRFNNITLISPHGLPGEMEPNELTESVLHKSYCYTKNVFAKMGLRIWVNSVFGKMTAINRALKVVVVNQNTHVPYDHLILCIGKQYQVPAPTNIVTEGPVSERDLTNNDNIYLGSKPENLFLVNDEFDSALLIAWVETNILNTYQNIVIYGETLDAYTTVYTLLKKGVPGSNIIMVKPPPKTDSTCFNDPVLDEAVKSAVLAEQITVYNDYVFSYWSGKSPDTLKIMSLTFVSAKANSLKLDCGLFISFAVYNIDQDAFKAMNNACLVYDGALVIDAAFHTNDVSIRAAGPMTKFKRRYHVGEWSHAVFNSKEIGISLASSMLRLFDPILNLITEPQEEVLNLIPIYRNAKITGCTLPGGYEYLHVQKPNLPATWAKQREDYINAKEIITGTPTSKGYFRLQFNQYCSVEIITCFSLQPFCVNNLMCLYGVHDRFLNNIFVRYHDSLIHDLYEFFKEPWCLALFHDRYDDFCDEVRELLMTKPGDDIESIEEKLREIVDDEIPLTNDQIAIIIKDFRVSGTKGAVEIRLLNYLGYNYYHLPMYAKPGMV